FLISTSANLNWVVVVWWAITTSFCVHLFFRSKAASKIKVERVSKRAARRLVLLSSLLACPWVFVVFYAVGFGGVDQAHSVLILLACTGMASGGTFMLHRALFAAVSFNTFILGSTLIAAHLGALPQAWMITVFVVVYWVFLGYFAFFAGETASQRDLSVTALSASVKELELAKDKNFRLANIDSVTGLPNRKAFRERLTEEIEEAAREGAVFSVLMMDLDHFKNINDLFGHHAGDELLSVVGDRLSRLVSDNDYVARLGGDEFAILLKGRDADEAGHHAMECIKALSDPVRIAGQMIHPGGSVGACAYPRHAEEASEILKNADLALHRAKELGRLRCVVFDKVLNARIVDADKVERGLRRALNRGLIRMAYQPKICLETRTIIGAEALVRWRDPDLGPVAPDRFLPIAAERGLLPTLSGRIANLVGKDMTLFRENNADFGKISINVHPVELKSPQLLLNNVEKLSAHGIYAEHLVLEVTEGCFVGRVTEGAPDILDRLAGEGYDMSLDDFGTGHASLSHLRDLPVKEIKIDRTFVNGVCNNDQDRSIVSAISEIAHGMGIRSVAEGVETFEQFEAIRSLGVDMGQGYLWSRPLFARDYLDFASVHMARLEVAGRSASPAPLPGKNIAEAG
ncbi:MAG: EAL domain-containing protein, partial [Pseudomonadota bacterium]